MRRLLLVLPVAACTLPNPATDPAPAANYPQQCEDAVYADPTVKQLLAASAGSPTFARQEAERLRYAKLDAARRCEQQRGLVPSGGGVERPALRY
jgi:hypothetical protein